MGISVPASASVIDRIRQIHGIAVANELIEFTTSSARWGFVGQGWISNANYHVKKTTLLLFINHRAVESSAIKRAVEQTYATFLPKGGHPFVYLSLEIEPQRVDVNIHPTKREVNFLHEEEIIECICNAAREALASVDTSRTFMTQTLLPNAQLQATATPSRPLGRGPGPELHSMAKKPPRADNDLVRTDSRARKITSMLDVGGADDAASAASAAARERLADIEYETTDKEATTCRLHSIRDLRADVRDAMHNGLTDVFASHTYVGLVDPRRRVAAVQGGVKLFLVDYAMVCNEYFYQVGLTDFGNFGSIRMKTPLDLTELLAIGAQQERQLSASQDDLDWDDVVARVRAKLMDRRDMLAECFSLEISDAGELRALPLLVRGYAPSLAKLPNFLLRLGPCVDWDTEKPCFRDMLRELASFHVPEPLPPAPDASAADGEGEAEDAEIAARRRHVERALEEVLFPAFRARLVATKGLLKGVVEVANLKGLYRVFERC
jgi:DNA mismatch repair protein MLH1